MSEVRDQLTQENLWGYLKRLRFVRRVIFDSFRDRQPSSLRILDVGCGNGSQLALSLVKDGFDLTGIDTDRQSIEHARRLSAGANNARFLCGRVEELNDAEVFDVVILSEVLEHVHDPLLLLKAAMRRLSTGGVMIITVPNGYGEFEIDWWIFRSLGLQRVVDAFAKSDKDVVGSTDNKEDGHVQFFTRRRLKELFSECELRIFVEGTSSFIGGPILGHLFGRYPGFIEWNAQVTDKLPSALASGWFFALRREVN